MEQSIVANKLYKSFGSVRAVDGLSLAVQAGEIYGLVGPDGAGKTTTMRLLCGALQPDSGRAAIYGYDVMRNPDAAREQIGYLAQRFSLYGDLTVMENLRFFAEMHGLREREWRPRTQAVLKFVGLAEFSHRRAEQLSGGMKQKLGLATALVHQPKVLLLDEPTGGVDPVTRQDFWQLLIRIVSRESVSVLVSTPYMDEASRCTRIGFMYRGRLITEGVPGAVAARLAGRVLELVGSPRDALRRTALADPDVEDVQVFGDRLHLRVSPGRADRVLARLPVALQAASAQVQRFRSIAPTLEDAFIELLEAAQDE
ncbi:MAG TPA: ABC transporter ATP-binding protein [Anaerolineae bacterium]|nr:ABC transporter ATP-binding protein [Anaerolineae bacterium]